MATLATAIANRLRALLPAATLADLTTQRDPSASTEDASVTTEAAAQAAAEVEGVLGDGITDADAQAVAFGTKFALLDLAATYTFVLPATSRESRAQLDDKLDRLAAARVGAAGAPVTARGDLSQFDAAYPGTTWVDEFGDEYIQS